MSWVSKPLRKAYDYSIQITAFTSRSLAKNTSAKIEERSASVERPKWNNLLSSLNELYPMTVVKFQLADYTLTEFSGISEVNSQMEARKPLFWSQIKTNSPGKIVLKQDQFCKAVF